MKHNSESVSQLVCKQLFRLGFLINPLAGLGGSVALKGSDGVAEQALARGAIPRASQRASAVLERLLPWREQILVLTADGAMGAAVAQALGFATEIVYRPGLATSADDTRQAARVFKEVGVDLLLFAGGDGTARDLAAVLGLSLPVLGIPAGVKMHSGVFAVTPQGAAEIVQLMLAGEMVLIDSAEVRDIDENALREGRVASRYFAEMRVPSEPRYLQQVKCNGREVEGLVQQEIAAELIENLEPGVSYLVGPGTSTAAFMEALDIPVTLLGVDVIRDGALVHADADAVVLEACCAAGPCRLILSATGGQGMVLGRGNQQITPKVLQAVGRDGLIIVATHEKLKALEGRPLLMDVPDENLAETFTGFVEVVTGYQNRVLYRLATHA
jgi:predicted polyphosphate/ATP-dependent NAD kinase